MKYWYKPYISPGNHKMSIPQWSIPAEATCLNSTPMCRKYCYAKKAERQWSNVRRSRIRNFALSLRDDFIYRMIREIQRLYDKEQFKYFRIHESGDMFSQEYLDKWFIIIKYFPHINFSCYTKMYDLDWSNAPDNFIVWWSVWPDTDEEKIPEGRKFYTLTSDYQPEVDLVCPYSKGDVKGCEECLICYNSQFTKNNMKVGIPLH